MRKPCEGHTVSVVDRSLYILFGKHEVDHGKEVLCVCPPMQVLDTKTMVLSSPPTDCDLMQPKEREGHTATVVGQRIFIFGGTWTDEEDTTIYMNDLHVLDVRTLTWSLPNTSGCPPIEREGHTASAVETRLFIFGGTWVDCEDQSHYLNDLHLLDVETMPMGWSVGVCSGEPPSQREGHTSSVVGAQIVVFGGAGLDVEDRPVNLNDLHILDTERMAWSRPVVSGRVPQERRYHSASVVDQRLLVFGGQYYDAATDLHLECDNSLCIFDAETLAWATVAVDSHSPLRRACHAAGVVSKHVFLIGGRYWDKEEDDYIFLNDIQVLDTHPSSTLVADWRAFLNNPLLSDITIMVGGTRVHAHRVVLAARCAYFRGMFESGMKESTQTEVSLEDISYDVFHALLEHLYTDRVDVTSEIALELFAAADFLGVEQLKSICVSKIESELSVDTVCHTLTVADKHSATPLKDVCVKYIVDHFKEVHSTAGFHELSRNLLSWVHAGVAAMMPPAGAGASGLPRAMARSSIHEHGSPASELSRAMPRSSIHEHGSPAGAAARR